MESHDLIHDWNEAGERWERPAFPIQLDDETLRDGLQSPSVRTPPIEDKVAILHLMDRLGIDTADIGLPGAGPHVVADVRRLASEIATQKLRIRANCAARTLRQDITPVIEVSQQVGIPIEVCAFIGSSHRVLFPSHDTAGCRKWMQGRLNAAGRPGQDTFPARLI